MRSVGFGKSDSFKYQTNNVAGLVLVAKLTHTTVNTAFAGSPMLWDQINVTMTLKRNGAVHTIFDDAVLPLAIDSDFFAGNFEQVSAVGTPTIPKLVAAAAGVKEVVAITAKINLHSVINLGKGDELLVEVNCLQGGAGAGVDTTVSEVLWDIQEGIGNGISIPMIKAETIRANEGNTPVACGDNVISVTFVNNDKSGIALANQVLQSVNFTSDKVSRIDTYDELLAKRDNQFVSQAESAKRHQSFNFISVPTEKMTSDDVRLNRVQMRLSFVSANLNAGKNWVVSRTFINDVNTAQRAVSRANKHRTENNAQYV